MSQVDSLNRMAASLAEIVQTTGDFHDQILEVLFGVAVYILDNATAFDP